MVRLRVWVIVRGTVRVRRVSVTLNVGVRVIGVRVSVGIRTRVPKLLVRTVFAQVIRLLSEYFLSKRGRTR